MRTESSFPLSTDAIRIFSERICGIPDSRSFQRLGGSARQSSGKQGRARLSGTSQEESSYPDSFQRPGDREASYSSMGPTGMTEFSLHASLHLREDRDASARHFHSFPLESYTSPHSPSRRNAAE